MDNQRWRDTKNNNKRQKAKTSFQAQTTKIPLHHARKKSKEQSLRHDRRVKPPCGRPKIKKTIIVNDSHATSASSPCPAKTHTAQTTMIFRPTPPPPSPPLSTRTRRLLYCTHKRRPHPPPPPTTCKTVTRTSPVWGSLSRTTILISVVFPAPLTPVTPTRDARHSLRLAP